MPPKSSAQRLRDRIRVREERGRAQRRAAQLPQELYRRQITSRPHSIRIATANSVRARMSIIEKEKELEYLKTTKPNQYVTRAASVINEIRNLRNVMQNPGDYFWNGYGFNPTPPPPPPPPPSVGGGAPIFT